MKNLIIGVLIGVALASTISFADISIEKLWNKVFDTTNNVIRVEGI